MSSSSSYNNNESSSSLGTILPPLLPRSRSVSSHHDVRYQQYYQSRLDNHVDNSSNNNNQQEMSQFSAHIQNTHIAKVTMNNTTNNIILKQESSLPVQNNQSQQMNIINDDFHNVRDDNLDADYSKSLKWPEPFDDLNAIQKQYLQQLPLDFADIQKNVYDSKSIQIKFITWNQQAQPTPTVEELRSQLFPARYYHIIAVGTQECDNTITRSMINPSKEHWERICINAVGDDYQFMRGHSLQGTHLVLFAHKSILDIISNVNSHAVATGICDKLGNKGGIGISLKIGLSTFCFLTAHLSAHHHQLERRILEFDKISTEVALNLGHEIRINPIYRKNDYHRASTLSSSYSSVIQDDIFLDDDEEIVSEQHLKLTSLSSSTFSRPCSPCLSKKKDYDDDYNNTIASNATNLLLNTFNFVFWGGDLNFRINGTRNIVDKLLNTNQHSILVDQDQLTFLLRFDTLFSEFSEGPLTFRPTYKYDVKSDLYDTSSKRRIPSWTDRILFKAGSLINNLSYYSVQDIKTSDHRPVCASFQCHITIRDRTEEISDPKTLIRCQSKSEVCILS